MSQQINTNPAQASSQVLQVAKPAAGENASFESQGGAKLAFDFDPADATVSRSGNDLVFQMDDGGSVTLSRFFEVGDQPLPSLVLPAGDEVASADFLAQFDIDLETAAGPGGGGNAASGGSGEYADDPGSLVGGINRLGSLGTIFWGRQTDIAEEYSGAEEASFSFSFGFVSTSDLPDPKLEISEEGWITGRFRNMLFEDGMPNQHLPGGKSDTTQFDNLQAEYGITIPDELSARTPGILEFTFDPSGTTQLTSLTLSGFTVGTVVLVGSTPTEITSVDQQIVLTPDQANGFVGVYPPLDNLDADMPITATVVGTAANGNFMTETQVVTLVVDAVADLATGEMGISFDAQSSTFTEENWEDETPNDNIPDVTIGELNALKLGVFVQFDDYKDSSEFHTVEVKGIPSQWRLPSGQDQGENPNTPLNNYTLLNGGDPYSSEDEARLALQESGSGTYATWGDGSKDGIINYIFNVTGQLTDGSLADEIIFNPLDWTDSRDADGTPGNNAPAEISVTARAEEVTAAGEEPVTDNNVAETVLGQYKVIIVEDTPTFAPVEGGTLSLLSDETKGTTEIPSTEDLAAIFAGEDVMQPLGAPISYTQSNVTYNLYSDFEGEGGGARDASKAFLGFKGTDGDSLWKTTDGTTIKLHYTEDGNVVGYVGDSYAAGEVAFVILVSGDLTQGGEQTGTVTFIQYLALQHPTGGQSHDEPLENALVFTDQLVLTDDDGDSTSITVTINVDDDGPRIGCGFHRVTLFESDIDGKDASGGDTFIPGTDAGHGVLNTVLDVYNKDPDREDTKGREQASGGGKLVLDFGADGQATTDAFVWDTPSMPLKAMVSGVWEDVTFTTEDGGLTLIGTAGNETVFKLTMGQDSSGKISGEYSVNMYASLQHDTPRDDFYEPNGDFDRNLDLAGFGDQGEGKTGNLVLTDLEFGFTIKDGDGDTATGSITVNVQDDITVAHDSTSTNRWVPGDGLLEGMFTHEGKISFVSDSEQKTLGSELNPAEGVTISIGKVELGEENGKYTIKFVDDGEYDPGFYQYKTGLGIINSGIDDGMQGHPGRPDEINYRDDNLDDDQLGVSEAVVIDLEGLAFGFHMGMGKFFEANWGNGIEIENGAMLFYRSVKDSKGDIIDYELVHYQNFKSASSSGVESEDVVFDSETFFGFDRVVVIATPSDSAQPLDDSDFHIQDIQFDLLGGSVIFYESGKASANSADGIDGTSYRYVAGQESVELVGGKTMRIDTSEAGDVVRGYLEGDELAFTMTMSPSGRWEFIQHQPFALASGERLQVAYQVKDNDGDWDDASIIVSRLPVLAVSDLTVNEALLADGGTQYEAGVYPSAEGKITALNVAAITITVEGEGLGQGDPAFSKEITLSELNVNIGSTGYDVFGNGSLVITAYNSTTSEISYIYTLQNNEDHADVQGRNDVSGPEGQFPTITVSATSPDDVNGASGVGTVTVKDDISYIEVVSGTEDGTAGTTWQTHNVDDDLVETQVGKPETGSLSLTAGADYDGATLQVTGYDGTIPLANGLIDFDALNITTGKLVITTDTFEMVLTNGQNGIAYEYKNFIVAEQAITFTITDGDGDKASDTVTFKTGQFAFAASVDESWLATGTMAGQGDADYSKVAGGTGDVFSLSAADTDSLVINGTAVVWDGDMASVKTSYGELTLTRDDTDEDGVYTIAYSYQLENNFNVHDANAVTKGAGYTTGDDANAEAASATNHYDEGTTGGTTAQGSVSGQAQDVFEFRIGTTWEAANPIGDLKITIADDGLAGDPSSAIVEVLNIAPTYHLTLCLDMSYSMLWKHDYTGATPAGGLDEPKPYQLVDNGQDGLTYGYEETRIFFVQKAILEMLDQYEVSAGKDGVVVDLSAFNGGSAKLGNGTLSLDEAREIIANLSSPFTLEKNPVSGEWVLKNPGTVDETTTWTATNGITYAGGTHFTLGLEEAQDQLATSLAQDDADADRFYFFTDGLRSGSDGSFENWEAFLAGQTLPDNFKAFIIGLAEGSNADSEQGIESIVGTFDDNIATPYYIPADKISEFANSMVETIYLQGTVDMPAGADGVFLQSVSATDADTGTSGIKIVFEPETATGKETDTLDLVNVDETTGFPTTSNGNQSFVVTADGQPVGTVTFAQNGEFSFKPDPSFKPDYGFTMKFELTFMDGDGDTLKRPMEIIVPGKAVQVFDNDGTVTTDDILYASGTLMAGTELSDNWHNIVVGDVGKLGDGQIFNMNMCFMLDASGSMMDNGATNWAGLKAAMASALDAIQDQLTGKEASVNLNLGIVSFDCFGKVVYSQLDLKAVDLAPDSDSAYDAVMMAIDSIALQITRASNNTHHSGTGYEAAYSVATDWFTELTTAQQTAGENTKNYGYLVTDGDPYDFMDHTNLDRYIEISFVGTNGLDDWNTKVYGEESVSLNFIQLKGYPVDDNGERITLSSTEMPPSETMFLELKGVALNGFTHVKYDNGVVTFGTYDESGGFDWKGPIQILAECGTLKGAVSNITVDHWFQIAYVHDSGDRLHHATDQGKALAAAIAAYEKLHDTIDDITLSAIGTAASYDKLNQLSDEGRTYSSENAGDLAAMLTDAISKDLDTAFGSDNAFIGGDAGNTIFADYIDASSLAGAVVNTGTYGPMESGQNHMQYLIGYLFATGELQTGASNAEQARAVGDFLEAGLKAYKEGDFTGIEAQIVKASIEMAATGADEGDDIVAGGIKADSLFGQAGNDVILGDFTGTVAQLTSIVEALKAGTPLTDDQQALVNGAGEADFIHGGAGDDFIHGGAGDDIIFGGQGSDTLYGGDGKDTFVWTADDFNGKDTIMDFNLDTDKLFFADILTTGELTVDKLITMIEEKKFSLADITDDGLTLTVNKDGASVDVEIHLATGSTADYIANINDPAEQALLLARILTETM